MKYAFMLSKNKMSLKIKKSGYIILPLVSFLFFQIILIYYARITDYDEAVFLDIARNIRRVHLPIRSIGPDGVLYFIHTPLYLYLVTASVMLLGDNPMLARLVTTAFAMGSIILTYMTVRQQQTAISSLVAALLLALNTFIALYAYFLTMAVPMMFFILLAIYWLAKDNGSPAWNYWFGAGIATALAVMLKELALIFMIALALYAFIFGRTWQERITHSFWVSLPTVVALAIWSWWGITLNPIQFKAGVTRWLGLASGVNNAAGSRDLQTIAWIRTLGDDVFSWGIIVLFIAVVFAYFYRFRHKLPPIIWLLFLYLGLASSVSFLVKIKEPRHIIALIPIMAMIIGMLIEWGSVWIWVKEKQTRLIMATFIALLLAWNISPLKTPPPTQYNQIEAWWEPLFAHRIFHSQHYYGLLKDTGQYLAKNTPPNTIITVVHEGPIVGYYADRSHYFLYTMSYPRVLEVLENTEYLIVDDRLFFNLTPEEVTTVMTYIETEFELKQLMKDAYREIRIYQRQY